MRALITFILIIGFALPLTVYINIATFLLHRQPTGMVTFWFDDNWLSPYTCGAINLLDDEHYPAALAVTTDFVGQPNYLSWQQIHHLHKNGWEITSHSSSHLCDPALYQDENIIKHELLDSKTQLELQGFQIEQFVIPCGFNTKIVPNVVNFAKKYYLSYREAEEQINPLPIIDPYDIKSFSVTNTTTEHDIKQWFSEAKKQHGWLIIVFHQIDDSHTTYAITLDMFKKILAITKKEKLPVVLPKEALAYQTTT